MARLVIFDETVRGVDLSGHPVILGRSRRVDVPIRDRLLSRKHCSLVPGSNAFQIVDLKSSNGTFLNGVRIEKEEVKFEDIIEIGTTVMVLLDTDTWESGNGLPRVRHPDKAKSLIEAIKRREVAYRDFRREGTFLSSGGGKPTAWLRQKKVLTPEETECLEWMAEDGVHLPAVSRYLEMYVAHQVVSLMIRHSPRLGEKLSAVVEKVLTKESFDGGEEGLLKAVRLSLDEELRRVEPTQAEPTQAEPTQAEPSRTESSRAVPLEESGEMEPGGEAS